MKELLEEADKRYGRKEPSPARVFLEFKYPEIKELLKHFLTLISASLVFSVTFSEKIIDFSDAGIVQQAVVIASWFFLVLALGACGIGIYTLYLAAERAIHDVVYDQHNKWGGLARYSYYLQDAAGILFGMGLALLVVGALFR